jgi:phage terminase large subunit
LRIRLPNDWRPRGYQRAGWDYLERGGRHAEFVWHRRSGKDEVALHRTAVAAVERIANYWHMLPQANQVRKAIWEAVNPHTGKRRIDEAFPLALRANTREQEMFIRFKNGSSWQALGSDNYEGAIGSAPAGIVYSEWAQANPSARGYLRPILAENNGWQIFITTPRGKNHAHQTFQAARKQPDAFAELLTAHDTGVFSASQLEDERLDLIGTYGQEAGRALFEQEYFCSFEAAILGAYYSAEMTAVDRTGRITRVEYDPEWPVHTAWDLGYDDDTAIWWYQVVHDEVHLLGYYFNSGKDIDHYADVISGKPYRYGTHWLPHDAKAKTLAAAGKSIQEQLANRLGWGSVWIAPTTGGAHRSAARQLPVEDGIQAVRQLLPRCWFDEEGCVDGIEAMRQYHREWDDDRKMFKDRPYHDWTSHPADAFRTLAVAWQKEYQAAPAMVSRKHDSYGLDEYEETWKTA